MTSRNRRILGVAGAALLVMSVAASLVVALVQLTALQEARYRLMGLAGVAPIVVAGCAAAATVGAAVALVQVRSRRWLLLVALVPWLLLVQMTLPTLAGMVRPERAVGGEQFTVVAQNLWYENADPDATAEAIVDRGADVIVLTELTAAHARAFEQAADGDYPYRWVRSAPLGAGIGVLSRIPFGDPVDVALSTPAVRLDLQIGDRPVALFAIHPVSPSDMYSIARWKHDYSVLLDEAASMGPDTVIAGDFNATRGHRRFRALLAEADLRDAQDASGTGFRPTWPIGAAFPPLMRLDHILVGSGVGIADFQVVGDIGSDHLGVEARLQVPRS